jgi:hypothetical protein
MSTSARIRVAFQKCAENYRIVRVRPSEVFDAFIRFGWSLEGRVDGQHVPARLWSFDDPLGQLEYQGSQAAALDTVRQWEPDRASIAAVIWWPQAWQGGDLYVHQREQSLSLGLNLANWRAFPDLDRELPGYKHFPDLNWYIPKLVRPLELIDAGAYEVTTGWEY